MAQIAVQIKSSLVWLTIDGAEVLLEIRRSNLIGQYERLQELGLKVSFLNN